MKRLMFLAFLLLLPACDSAEEDSPIQGCTDPEAVNFNFLAAVNDFSCVYTGQISFYMQTDAHGNVNISVNDRFVGTLDRFWTGQPGACRLPGTVTIQGRTDTPRFLWIAEGGDGTITGDDASFVRGCGFIRVF